MPAFTSSSLYFPILERSSLLGRTPASEFLSALTITMTLIVLSPVCFLPGPGLSDGTDRPNPASIWTSNERRPDRQVQYAFLGGTCGVSATFELTILQCVPDVSSASRQSCNGHC